jgi:hypothetical protein
MKKAFVVLAVALMAVAAQAQSTFTLCAGQNTDVGTVEVWNDATNVYVKFSTTGGALITETHVHVATSLTGIPKTKSGNPVPGQFAEQEVHTPPVTEYTYTFPRPAGTSVVVAAHAVVVEGSSLPVPYPADTVITAVQGLRKDGTPVLPERSNPDLALAYGDGFYSMGFGGTLTVEFDCPITNRTGDDFAIWERTDGVYPPESVNVYASEDNITWHLIGVATNGRTAPASDWVSEHGNFFDLGSLTSAKYIRLVDTSDPNLFEGSADAFDVEAIKSYQACTGDSETAWGGACGGGGQQFVGKNWATYVTHTLTN